MGIFLLTDVHFAITVISDHHYDHHDHHRLNNNDGGDNNGQWQLELETHLCLEPQVCFLFFANVLTYAQGVASAHEEAQEATLLSLSGNISQTGPNNDHCHFGHS